MDIWFVFQVRPLLVERFLKSDLLCAFLHLLVRAWLGQKDWQALPNSLRVVVLIDAPSGCVLLLSVSPFFILTLRWVGSSFNLHFLHGVRGRVPCHEFIGHLDIFVCDPPVTSFTRLYIELSVLLICRSSLYVLDASPSLVTYSYYTDLSSRGGSSFS